MKRQLFIAGLLTAVGVVTGVAQAAPISLPAGSPLYIQYTNAEQICLTNCITSGAAGGEGNWGIMTLSSIDVGNVIPPIPNSDIGDIPSKNVYRAGVTPGYITGIFYGIDFTSPTTATGGHVDLYWHNSDTSPCGDGFSTTGACALGGGTTAISTYRTGQASYTGWTSGTLLAQLDFLPEVIPGDNTTTISSTTNPAVTTGNAVGYLGVNLSNVGAWTHVLNDNWFKNYTCPPADLNPANCPKTVALPTAADVFNKSSYNFSSGWNDTAANGDSIIGLSSSDPVRTHTVPEPSEVALLGVGLAVLGGLTRRRRKA